jgi:hypothetical protein
VANFARLSVALLTDTAGAVVPLATTAPNKSADRVSAHLASSIGPFPLTRRLDTI